MKQYNPFKEPDFNAPSKASMAIAEMLVMLGVFGLFLRVIFTIWAIIGAVVAITSVASLFTDGSLINIDVEPAEGTWALMRYYGHFAILLLIGGSYLLWVKPCIPEAKARVTWRKRHPEEHQPSGLDIESECIECQSIISQGESTCPKCGWSYIEKTHNNRAIDAHD